MKLILANFPSSQSLLSAQIKNCMRCGWRRKDVLSFSDKPLKDTDVVLSNTTDEQAAYRYLCLYWAYNNLKINEKEDILLSDCNLWQLNNIVAPKEVGVKVVGSKTFRTKIYTEAVWVNLKVVRDVKFILDGIISGLSEEEAIALISFKKINPTYGVGEKDFSYRYLEATKPIGYIYFREKEIQRFLGKNEFGKNIIDTSLHQILKEYNLHVL